MWQAGYTAAWLMFALVNMMYERQAAISIIWNELFLPFYRDKLLWKLIILLQYKAGQRTS